MLNPRWIRTHLARWVPEAVKAPFRARLFGYGATGLARGTVGPPGDLVECEIAGVRFRAPGVARDDLAYHLVDNADSVDEMHAVVRAARERGGMLMDVGAARGLISAVFCLAADGARAVAYEPAPGQARDAERLAEMNGVADRIQVRRAAVGASPAAMRGREDALGLIDLAPAEGADTFDVEMTTLDAETARLGVPTVVKIDVEGYELEVLRGATSLLREHRPLLLLELHLDILERRGVRIADVTALLDDAGYRLETSAGKRLSTRAVHGSPNAVLRIVAR
ncbi:MAG TPA: FkbM family methyltransferase [Longimicrobiaceae bacterium]|nr:FkbM family methyltransferase [Longimicrobiaceae bacterium]